MKGSFEYGTSQFSKYISVPAEGRNETLERWVEGATDFNRVAEKLVENGYAPTSGREILSAGFYGPIFTIQTDKGPIVEKTYIYGGARKPGQTDVGKRFRSENFDRENAFPVRTRLTVVGSRPEHTHGVIDWVYNEEIALKNLRDIPGIPMFIAAVYDGTRGSVLEQRIQGYDLWECPKHITKLEDLDLLFNCIERSYVEAAQRGFLLNNPAGSSIMVDEESQRPFLLDWHNHQNIPAGQPATVASIAKGLTEIHELKARFASQISQTDH